MMAVAVPTLFEMLAALTFRPVRLFIVLMMELTLAEVIRLVPADTIPAANDFW